MEKEENVYVENTGTEEIATAKSGENARSENASAVPEKFKDVDALVRAYGALQAEFTRRSQRLKELEKQAENFKTEGGDGSSAGSGAEKLRKKADKHKSEQRAFDAFVADVESARSTTDSSDVEKPQETPITSAALQAENANESGNVGESEEKTNGKGTTETKNSVAVQPFVSDKEGTAPSVATGCEIAELSSEALYERVCRDENVRLRVIGEYLSSVGKAGAPLMKGGAGTLAAPPLKARTVEEAGSMALRFFKSAGVQA